MRFHYKIYKNIRLNTKINWSIKSKKLSKSLSSEYLLYRLIFLKLCFFKSFCNMKSPIGRGRGGLLMSFVEKHSTTEYVNERALLPKQLAFLEISQSISQYHISRILRYKFYKFQQVLKSMLVKTMSKET